MWYGAAETDRRGGDKTRTAKTPPTDAAGFIERLADIKLWKQGDTRAPHKPLLLLLVLSRLARGDDRVVRFADMEERLRDLIREYGPTRKSYHPEFPFWHLMSDGIWEIPNKADIDRLRFERVNVDSPTAADLRKAGAAGGLPEPIWNDLRRNPVLTRTAVQTILNCHFPETMHEDLLTELGLASGAPAASPDRKAGRAPDFRDLVLNAYLNRCAICGFNGQFDSRTFGVEAAHVQWHSHQGPSTLENGLCLCVFHHKAFDRGVMGISDSLRILISPRLQKNDHTYQRFYVHENSILLHPIESRPPPAEKFIHWHRKNCFRA